MYPYPQTKFGNVFDDIGDAVSDAADAVGDVATSIGDSPALKAVGKVMKAAAPFVAMIPGVGTIVGTAMYAVGSIAAGDHLDDITIGTIRSALPENMKKSYDDAVDCGYRIARGENIADVTIHEARNYAEEQGGKEAVAVFDMGVSVGKGRGLQDAGFKVMGAWVGGSDIGERAVVFAEDVTKAAQSGKPVAEFIRDEAITQFVQSVPALKQAYFLEQAIEYFLNHPEVLLDYVEQTATESAADFASRNVPSSEHPTPKFPKIVVDWFQAAEDAGVPVEAIRAAIICIKELLDGSLIVDNDTAAKFDKSRMTYEQGYVSENEKLGLSNAFLVSAPELSADRKRNDHYQRIGMALAALNTEIGNLRRSNVESNWLRGFDVGTTVSYGHSQPGSGQDAIRASLNATAQKAFDVARHQQFDAVLTGKKFVSLDDLEALGYKIAVLNPAVATLRSAGRGTAWSLSAFDLGTAVCMGKVVNGPGQDIIYSTLDPATEQPAFDVARHQQYDFSNHRIAMTLFVERTAIMVDAAGGKELADKYVPIHTLKNSESGADFQFGFDVGTGSAVGHSMPGPGLNMVRDLIGPDTVGGSPDGRGKGTVAAQRGFDAATALQFDITKSGGLGHVQLITDTAGFKAQNALKNLPSHIPAPPANSIHRSIWETILLFFGWT